MFDDPPPSWKEKDYPSHSFIAWSGSFFAFQILAGLGRRRLENESWIAKLSFLDDLNVSEDDQKLKETLKVIAGKEVTAKAVCFLTFGLYLVKSFTQQHLDIIGVTYNNKTRRLILMDGKGLFSLDLLASKTVDQV
ncbi:unnamed protein product [Natator depressus]